VNYFEVRKCSEMFNYASDGSHNKF